MKTDITQFKVTKYYAKKFKMHQSWVGTWMNVIPGKEFLHLQQTKGMKLVTRKIKV